MTKFAPRKPFPAFLRNVGEAVVFLKRTVKQKINLKNIGDLILSIRI